MINTHTICSLVLRASLSSSKAMPENRADFSLKGGEELSPPTNHHKMTLIKMSTNQDSLHLFKFTLKLRANRRKTAKMCSTQPTFFFRVTRCILLITLSEVHGKGKSNIQHAIYLRILGNYQKIAPLNFTQAKFLALLPAEDSTPWSVSRRASRSKGCVPHLQWNLVIRE